MRFIEELYNFLLIIFVNLRKIDSTYRTYIFPEFIFTLISWLVLLNTFQVFNYEIKDADSFLLVFVFHAVSMFIFMDLSPDDWKNIDEVKEEIGYTSFKFYRNTIIIILVIVLLWMNYFS